MFNMLSYTAQTALVFVAAQKFILFSIHDLADD
jgi:hypothetical protein